MTIRDNVIELRKIRHADTLVERIIHGAAAEIERLREELEEAKAASLDGQNAMVSQINALCETLRIVNDKMAELRSERDEARRDCCRAIASNWGGEPKDIAKEHGWDCFKENTND